MRTKTLLAVALFSILPMIGCVSRLVGVIKGPGNYYYLTVDGAKAGIYKCTIEGETLKCSDHLKINVDDYGDKPDFYKKG